MVPPVGSYLLLLLLLSLLLLLLSLNTSSAATTLRKESLCAALGGSCQQRHSGCKGRTLSSLCYSGAMVCCTPGRRDWLGPGVTIKRVYARGTCPSNPKRCQKKGGRCQADSLPCDTLAVDRLCKAESCTCCLQNQDDACKRKVGCEARGGFCVRGSRQLCQREGGQVIKRGCKGRKCSCCVPGDCSCGKANNRRIVGGWATVPPYKYPWLTGLKITDITGTTGKYFCGGAIINNKFILSAAHCLYNQFTASPYDPDMLMVGIGDHNQVSTDDDLPGVTQLVSIEEIIIHHEYQFLKPEHDIGLIRLSSSIDLTSYPQVQAVCLPTDIYESYEGRIGMAYGWGVVEEMGSEQPDIAREVGLTIWDDKCNGKTIGKVKITSQMLCAGEIEGGKDTCRGDSGGPLTVEEDSIHVLVGITSFGSGCGKPNSPGVYTRVTEYLDWIFDNTQGTSFCNN